MKERPILFNGEMVRAIIEGRKTQTRRVAKLNNGYARNGATINALLEDAGARYGACPLGRPGERLWVRESIELHSHGSISKSTYCADGAFTEADEWPWKRSKLPSIHMPRWASRITLEITGVRFERLQDISEEDAKAEGLRYHHIYSEWGGVEVHPDSTASAPQWRWYESPVEAFKQLWISINGQESWNANPWVWVVEFKQETPND